MAVASAFTGQTVGPKARKDRKDQKDSKIKRSGVDWTLMDTLGEQLSEVLAAHGLSPEQLDALASQLLWRVGRHGDEGPVTVRVGFAGSAELFAELPRLKSASDAELEEAAQTGALRVEWVGARPRP